MSRPVRPKVLTPWWWKSSNRNPVAVPEPEDSPAARVEAVLFVAREPLPSRKLAELAGVEDGTAARTLCRELNETYDARGTAFRVEHLAGGYQLLTRPQYHRWLRRLHQRRLELRLSGPALETLAIVAYRQPVLRSEIENIRGVACGEVLRQLMDRELVRIAGKSQELGRPFQYATTKRFLQVFGLRDLDDLPQAERLRKRSGGDGEVEPSDEDPIVSVTLQPISPSEDRVEDETLLSTLQAQADDEVEGDVADDAADDADEDWDDDEDDDDEWDDDDEDDDEWDDDDEDWDDDDDDEDWDDEDDLDDDEEDDWEEDDDEVEDEAV